MKKLMLSSCVLLQLVSQSQSNWQLQYLNAYNFDFGSTSTNGKYVGHLNLFINSINGSPTGKWGLNTGILKINFGREDSLLHPQADNVALEPLQDFSAGSRYLKLFNRYTERKQNQIWSFYVQPLYAVSSSKTFRAYVHGHLELMASSWSSRKEAQLLSQSTDTFTSVTGKETMLSASDLSKNINGLYGYFGAGFTMFLFGDKNASFFFQPTIGLTSNQPLPSSVDIQQTEWPVKTSGHWNSFYLIRAQYRQQLNNSVDLVVGTDIRGLFPRYAPLYAAFAGLNVSLQTLAGMFEQ